MDSKWPLNMKKKDKDELKKKQENLEMCLDLLEIDEDEFYRLLRDEPTKVFFKSLALFGPYV